MSQKLQETSLAAYRSLDPAKLAEIYRQILYALSQIGEASYEDVAAFLKIDKGKVWRRISDLLKMELIYRTGKKKALRSGRAGNTYSLTDKSLPKTEAAEKALTGRSVSDYARSISAIAKTVPGKQGNLF